MQLSNIRFIYNGVLPPSTIVKPYNNNIFIQNGVSQNGGVVKPPPTTMVKPANNNNNGDSATSESKTIAKGEYF